MSAELVEERAGDGAEHKTISDIKALFNELALRRFGKEAAEEDQMKAIHSLASHAIAAFEKVKLK